MWSGTIATIPSGFSLCNGSNGTPDLSDRFIVGAGTTYTVGLIGGEATHTLTENEMPSHKHTWSITAVDTKAGAGTSYVATGNSNVLGTVSVTSSTTGGGLAHNNLPPYYALCFIMKS